MDKHLAALDKPGLIELTREMVGLRTPNPPADYSVIAPRMKELMDELGLETAILEGQPGKPNVVGLWRGQGDGPTLLLDAHMDVVPAGKGWKRDPWAAEIEDGIMWGRGTVDMKHALAILIAVTRALKKSGFTPRGNLMLSATNDDETAGKMGLKYVVEEGLQKIGWPQPDFHFLLEASDWNINLAYKGRTWIRVGVEGKSAHGGTPEKGVNAIEQTIKLINRVLAIPRSGHPLIGSDTINVGTIRGGEKTNIVPDACEVTFDYRFVPPGKADEAVSRVRAAVDALAAEDPDFSCNLFEVFEKREPFEIDKNDREIVLLKESVTRIRGTEPRYTGTLSAGNAYWSLNKGLRAIMTGPGDPALLHTDNEHISLKDLTEGAAVVLDFTTRYIG